MWIPENLYPKTHLTRVCLGTGEELYYTISEWLELPENGRFLEGRRPVELVRYADDWKARFLDDSIAKRVGAEYSPAWDDTGAIVDVLSAPDWLTYEAAEREWFYGQTVRLDLSILVLSVRGPAVLRYQTDGEARIDPEVFAGRLEQVVFYPTTSDLSGVEELEADPGDDDPARQTYYLALELPGTELGRFAAEVADRDDPGCDYDWRSGRAGHTDHLAFVERAGICPGTGQAAS
ncbi:hypothetical protein AALF15_10555 [Corynebacteriaceae bacterium 7-707]